MPSCDEQINPLKQKFIDIVLLYESFYKTSAIFGHTSSEITKMISCLFFYDENDPLACPQCFLSSKCISKLKKIDK